MDIVSEYGPSILIILVVVAPLGACVWAFHKAGLFTKGQVDRE